ncbi:AcrR family transcriptional regulator [Rhodococcus sp. OAS809]
MDAPVSDSQVVPNRRIPKQRRSQIKVSQILDAAAELLEKMPIDDLSVRVITQHAGVAPPTFYAYFSDRDAVLSALGMRYVEEAAWVMDQLDDRTFATWEDAVDAMVDAYVNWFRVRIGFRALWFSGHLDVSVVAADRMGNSAIADRTRSVLERAVGYPLDIPRYVSRFSVELADRLLRYGFEEETNGSELVFDEIKRALRAYVSTYMPSQR